MAIFLLIFFLAVSPELGHEYVHVYMYCAFLTSFPTVSRRVGEFRVLVARAAFCCSCSGAPHALDVDQPQAGLTRACEGTDIGEETSPFSERTTFGCRARDASINQREIYAGLIRH